MRVLIKYATYADGVTIHCLAEDARTVVAPFKRLQNLKTLYRLLKYVGGDAEQAKREIKGWGHGGVWVDVRPDDFAILGIKKTPGSQNRESGRSIAD